jgi:hypothetical protein
MTLTVIEGALLAELRKRRKLLRAEINTISEQIDVLILKDSPFQVGDEILAWKRGRGVDRGGMEDAVVMDVEPHEFGRKVSYWYRVGWRKKDGEFGRQNERVFDNVKAKP